MGAVLSWESINKYITCQEICHIIINQHPHPEFKSRGQFDIQYINFKRRLNVVNNCEFCNRQATSTSFLRETGEPVRVCDFCEEDLIHHDTREHLEELRADLQKKPLHISSQALENLIKLVI